MLINQPNCKHTLTHIHRRTCAYAHFTKSVLWYAISKTSF